MVEDEAAVPSTCNVEEFDGILIQEEHGLESSAHSEEHGYKEEGINCDNSLPDPGLV